MKYSKKAHCSSGKLLSWNKSGAQGPQGATGAQGARGAQGAQGPQGAQGANGSTIVTGYDNYTSNQSLPAHTYSYSSSGSTYSSTSYRGVVDAITPASTGVLDVTAATTLYGATYYECGLKSEASGFDYGRPMEASHTSVADTPITDTALVAASPSNPVAYSCYANHAADGVDNAMTAVDVTNMPNGYVRKADAKKGMLAQSFRKAMAAHHRAAAKKK